MQNTLAPEKQALLQQYVELLLQEGDRLGLTAFRTPEPIWSELITDSASAAEKLPEGGKIVDLGSGGGCPGVVLQVLRPDTKFYLLESNGRKAGFLRSVVEKLRLPSEVLQERSETVAHQPEYRAQFDMVVAKAVASLPVLIELALPLLKVKGKLLAYKGPQAQQEVDESAVALKNLHGRTLAVEPYHLGEKSYCHVIVEKASSTSKDWPRRPGIPAKQPLK
ncbi:MAG: 16S rRNA (guanine(527)-N(7))-methyltransferase RsmG [Candidatus Eremiobacteraeota bacterium]|nr:16S rRNA (guanine(527)-N(7))-methyltransferase RsmG [Candidatus Eremiobacteraeota bacterium]MCW5866507.1 16S rRNA (guanine(527)-N(7))-methyltransferase RsmG [Candidatus Eremiobacteraeota bacterium]